MFQARLAATATLCALLGGCAATGHHLGHLSAPDLPTVNGVRTTYVETARAFNGSKTSPAADTALSAQQYVMAGYRYVDNQCDEFFITLTQAQRMFDFTRKETVLGLSTANTILALAKTRAATLAYVAAGGVFLTNSIDNTADYIVLTRFTSQLEQIVQPTRDAYKATFPATSLGADDAAKFRAVELVQGYAKLCTIDHLEGIITTSLNQRVLTSAGDSGPMKAAVAAQLGLDGGSLSDDDLRTLSGTLSDTNANRLTKTGKFVDANRAQKDVYWYETAAAKTATDPGHEAGALTPLGASMKAGLSYLVASLPPAK